mmetsp:Transcript_12756/g.36425  ORF Transcript_12756/g.36425 Transcript_12756/m.36425 type:complete len:93 (-) Transcript_12756:633-911(-)
MLYRPRRSSPAVMPSRQYPSSVKATTSSPTTKVLNVVGLGVTFVLLVLADLDNTDSRKIGKDGRLGMGIIDGRFNESSRNNSRWSSSTSLVQ